jgi:hypothetical protein
LPGSINTTVAGFFGFSRREPPWFGLLETEAVVGRAGKVEITVWLRDFQVCGAASANRLLAFTRFHAPAFSKALFLRVEGSLDDVYRAARQRAPDLVFSRPVARTSVELPDIAYVQKMVRLLSRFQPRRAYFLRALVLPK